MDLLDWARDPLLWCCGGGAGAFLINRAAPLRQKAWEIKRAQVEATGAETGVVFDSDIEFNSPDGSGKGYVL